VVNESGLLSLGGYALLNPIPFVDNIIVVGTLRRRLSHLDRDSLLHMLLLELVPRLVQRIRQLVTGLICGHSCILALVLSLLHLRVLKLLLITIGLLLLVLHLNLLILIPHFLVVLLCLVHLLAVGLFQLT